MRAKLFSLCVLLAIALPAGSTPPAAAVDSTYYTYCVLVDNVHSVIYYSDIFPGNSSKDAMYRDAYHLFLHRAYSRLYGGPECTYTNTIYGARHAKENMQSHIRGAYRNLIETGWSY